MNGNKPDKTLMRDTVAFVLLAICVILTLLNNWRLEALEDQLGNLQSTLSMQLSNITYDIGGISDNVRSELEKETSIVSSSGVDIGFSGGKVRAEAWVAPRELRAGDEVSIVFHLDGAPKAIKAKLEEGGRYSAGINLTPCATLEAAIVVDGGGISRQETFAMSNVRDYTTLFVSCSNDSLGFIYDLYFKPEGTGDITMRLIKESTGEQYTLRAESGEGNTYRIDFSTLGDEFDDVFLLEAAADDGILFCSDSIHLKKLRRDLDYHMGDTQLQLNPDNWG